MALRLMLLTFLIASVLSECSIDDTKPKVNESIQKFSIELVKRIAEKKEYHFVSSPLSAWTLLSVLALGATNRTLEELKQVLEYPEDECFSDQLFTVLKLVSANTDETILETASAIFVNDIKLFKNTFIDKVKKAHLSHLEEVDFSKTDEATKTINDYASNATHGVIKQLVKPENLGQAFLVMINALYFKGSWKVPFDTQLTEKSKFFDENGTEIGSVNMMWDEQYNTRVGNILELEAKALELPYGHDGKYSMVLILPKKNNTVANVLNKLQEVSLKTVLDRMYSTKVDYRIPRFETSTDLKDLKDILIDMGLKRMFKSEAEFDEMTNSKVQVDEFIQKANVKVAENGTEAAAVSIAVFDRSSGEFFIANRPFVYFIVEKYSGVALFTGVYSKPSLQ